MEWDTESDWRVLCIRDRREWICFHQILIHQLKAQERIMAIKSRYLIKSWHLEIKMLEFLCCGLVLLNGSWNNYQRSFKEPDVQRLLMFSRWNGYYGQSGDFEERKVRRKSERERMKYQKMCFRHAKLLLRKSIMLTWSCLLLDPCAKKHEHWIVFQREDNDYEKDPPVTCRIT